MNVQLSEAMFKDNIALHHHWLWQFIYNKKVAIVGGASSWMERDADRCDLVIRINRNVIEQGGRCDAAYCSGYINVPLERASELYFCAVDLTGDDGADQKKVDAARTGIRNAQVNEIPFCSQRFGKPNPYSPAIEWCNQFGNELGTVPFTGIIAIRHMLMLPAAMIFVTGFTFYETQPGLFPIERGAHKIFPQMRWLAEAWSKDKRLVFGSDVEQRLVPVLHLIG